MPDKDSTKPSFGAIFDMDGVLVDSSEAHYHAWSRLGSTIGAPHPREVFERTFGMHNRQIIPIWLGEDVSAEEVERLSDLKEVMYREVASATLRPIEGAPELVRSLAAAGFSLAVGSSGPRANVDLVLEVLGLRDCFVAFSTGDEVHHGKPHPEVFLKAAAKLHLPPERCVVVEDAPQGIQAGLAAGARVVAVATTRPSEELGDAHLVVETLGELNPRCFRDLVGGGEGA